MPEAHIEITIDLTGGGADTTATVERGLSATGPWTMLNTSVPLLGQMAVFIDSTAPLDTSVWYRVTGDVDGSEILGPFSADSLGMAWLKDPLRPWATLAFDFCQGGTSLNPVCATPDPAFVWMGLEDEDWDADAGLFPILDAERPADVWARRKHLTSGMRFLTRTLAAKADVYTLFTAGGPLFLQLPAIYGWEDAYLQPGTVTPSRISRDQRRPERLWSVPFTTVDPVAAGPIQGALCATWCEVAETFATFADLTAAGGTYLDLADGSTVCP